MEIVTGAILLETLIQLLAAIITIYFSINILLRKRLYKQTKATSSTIIIYLYYQLIWGLFTVILDAYTIVLWRPETILYHQKVLYAIGFPSYMLTLLNTVIESFLGLDRCLCIIFPTRYKQTLKPIFGVITIIGFAIYTILMILMNKFMDTFWRDLTIPCRFFGCIILQNPIASVYFLKLATIIANAIIAVVLVGLLKYYMSSISSKSNKRIHKTIIFVIASTTFFELFPNILGNIFQKVGI